MTIKIYRGPGGNNSPFISFVGLTTDLSRSSSNVNFVDNIRAELSADSDRINIVNQRATERSSTTIYELEDVHYTDWEDGAGNFFSDAGSVVSFINNVAYDFDSPFDILMPRLSGTDTFLLSANTPYDLPVVFESGVRYYWDPTNIPPGMDISRYDNRRLEGTPTTPGTYIIGLEVGSSYSNIQTTVTVIVI